jgi:hypothetical protein
MITSNSIGFYDIETAESSIFRELVNYLVAGFQVPAAVVMKSFIFWDITPCSRALTAVCFMLLSCFAYSSTLKMEVPSKHPLKFNRLHGLYIPEEVILHLNIITHYVYLFNIYITTQSL